MAGSRPLNYQQKGMINLITIQAEPRLKRLLEITSPSHGSYSDVVITAIHYARAEAINHLCDPWEPLPPDLKMEGFDIEIPSKDLKFIRAISLKQEAPIQSVLFNCLKHYFRYLDDKGALF